MEREFSFRQGLGFWILSAKKDAGSWLISEDIQALKFQTHCSTIGAGNDKAVILLHVIHVVQNSTRMQRLGASRGLSSVLMPCRKHGGFPSFVLETFLNYSEKWWVESMCSLNSVLLGCIYSSINRRSSFGPGRQFFKHPCHHGYDTLPMLILMRTSQFLDIVRIRVFEGIFYFDIIHVYIPCKSLQT